MSNLHMPKESMEEAFIKKKKKFKITQMISNNQPLHLAVQKRRYKIKLKATSYRIWEKKRSIYRCMSKNVLTHVTSIRYPARILLRLIVLSWESLEGLESSLISILSSAHMLSKGGFCDWNKNKVMVRISSLQNSL